MEYFEELRFDNLTKSPYEHQEDEVEIVDFVDLIFIPFVLPDTTGLQLLDDIKACEWIKEPPPIVMVRSESLSIPSFVKCKRILYSRNTIVF